MIPSETGPQPRRGIPRTLLAIATLAPITLNGLSGMLPSAVPSWVGAAVSGAALSSALVLMWRQRHMRGVFLVALAGAVALAAAAGWWASAAT
jgi:hypothetical protein